MLIKELVKIIETEAPLALQESYDNAGLIIGNDANEISGVLICIDVTEKIVDEAKAGNFNMIVSHHPLIFSGLKRITGQNEVQKCVTKAIKNDIAIFAAHTNLDSVAHGVSGKMAEKIGLQNTQILIPVSNSLMKIVTYVPRLHIFSVREALFAAGAGEIGNYDSCSFTSEGTGTFRAKENAKPFVGSIDKFHNEPELRLELIFPAYLKHKIIEALLVSHPYEEPAYDIISLENQWNKVGMGIIGELVEPEDELDFLKRIKSVFNAGAVRYTQLLNKKICKVAVCGGSGSGLLKAAMAKQADVYISGDFKYHEFFDAENKILIADIGHFESEQFTKDVFFEIITKKMPTFAVRISEINTNPINYL